MLPNAANTIRFRLLVLLLACLVLQSCERKKRKPVIKEPLIKSVVTKQDTILLVSMAFTEVYLMPKIAERITVFYHIPVKHIISTLPAEAYYTPRNRYKANIIIDYLAPMKENRYRFVAGFTSKDISVRKGNFEDWGIFGLGTLNNGGCITSSFRLKKHASKQLLLERIEKVVLHEIGHNFGLEHCTSPYSCNMKDAEGKISSVDRNTMDLCSNCRSKIKLSKWKATCVNSECSCRSSC